MLKEFLINHLPIGLFSKISKINNRFMVLLYYLLRIIPISNKKIVITNYYGKGYGDNGKYIVEELIGKDVDCDLVWLLNPNIVCEFPDGIRIVRHGSLKARYEEVTAKVWIDNCRKPSYVRKRKGQYYIQTWHGGIAMKQIEKDAQLKLSSSYIDNAKNDSSIADLFISNSIFCSNMYRSAFWYDGEILECGSPRCDILINNKNDNSKKVRKHFNINRNMRLLIYAPTFRADYNTKFNDINFELLVDTVKKRFGGEWVILVRLHPNISNKSGFIKYNSTIINATDYDDMYELLAGSDILITDYSSTMFEFSFALKPVFLYATDIDDYIKDRNFYFDIHSLPYPLAENNKQLFELIDKFDSSIYLKGLNRFLSKLEIKEKGNASFHVVEKIKQVIS
jgi:CDP-glycerol glycerophosphotransferase